MIELLKLSKEFHPDDPLVLAAETRLREVHSVLRTAVNRREHERVLRELDIEDHDDDDDAGWVFESHGSSSEVLQEDGDQACEHLEQAV